MKIVFKVQFYILKFEISEYVKQTLDILKGLVYYNFTTLAIAVNMASNKSAVVTPIKATSNKGVGTRYSA